MSKLPITIVFFVLGSAIFTPVAAQDVQPASESASFIFNSLLFMIGGMVVMFMAAGFCMLEVGLVRAKNAATICVKNIALYAISGLMAWIIGYNIIYNVAPGGLIAPFQEWLFWQADDLNPMEKGFASHSDWFFQMVFVATAASIVSGTLAERIKLWPFLVFVIFLTGLIYPIQASWVWGKGYLAQAWHFSDFAGSSLVHSTGGWAALAGALVLGPRTGKYLGKHINPMPGSSLPLATLGTFILWLGWFGFNAGSQLAMGTIHDAISVAKIMVNTNMAAAAGVMAAMLLSSIMYKKVDLTLVLNGAIGGLVSITAEPLMPAIWQAVVIGSIGGIIVTLAVPLLDRLHIDDVVGAIPAHLFCGIWGTLVVVWSKNAHTVVNAAEAPTFFGQMIGVIMIGSFVFILSLLLWFLLKYTVGIRASAEQEQRGLDKVELGQDAWPDFTISH
ncbi:MAG: ammonium transporter [bacterium]